MRLLLALCLVLFATRPAAEEITVFAAASLQTALDPIAESYAARTNDEIRISYAGSSALARQIEYGAPADIFVSANSDWMDLLDERGLLAPGTRRDLLSNRLVLIGARDAEPVDIGPDLALAELLGEGRLAMALVDAVPAGIYGKAALTSLGLWPEVAPRVAQADNVRSALALVAAGEAPLGIVYATDAMADPRVATLGVFPDESHPMIVYPAAATADASPAALAFLDALSGPEAATRFEAAGFTVLPR
ncbi:molybdate ABC transporter substrate-binding protein [Histidinibacterium aquaticum]|uniref:Molybdate ABC transporter substrate-binding protein n=1 Tax=Histidinibacterium aquaticum TaxID=2613962 RepID=A0A5J5GQL1_9RHOB|nr:molybdate ABC transporter substrate-binding protein [Histidinibacterium aquaticum]KAA9010470.1 molybdate ABC transporter substrate-binding protein [Histidinibacterium aquaticum]